MKRLLILAALFFSISLFFFQSSSYTVADLKNDGYISFVPEDSALIAVRYEETPRFWITNNTDKTIYIERLEILGAYDYGIDSFDSSIGPGASGEFTITGDVASVIGNTLQISAHWDEGEAEISSVLPFFIIEEAPVIVPVITESPKEEEAEKKEEQAENTTPEKKSTEVIEQPDTQTENSTSEGTADTQTENSTPGSTTDMQINSPVEVPSNTNEED